MKINFTKLMEQEYWYNNWKANFLMNVLTEHTSNPNDWKETLGIDISKVPVMLDMKVTVNGHELPFDKWLGALEQAYSNALKQQAEKIIKEKIGNIQNCLNKIECELTDATTIAVDVNSGKIIQTEWLLSKLDGLSFPDENGAANFIKNLIGR